MTQHARLLPLGVDEYLEGELHSPVRHEYVAGRVFAMTGTSRAHNTIAINIALALRAHLRGGACRVFMSDLKVRVQKNNAFYYPDIAVSGSCASLRPPHLDILPGACHAADTQTHYLTHPCLVIEVLSPTTEGIDRREKLLAYQTLDSLKEYVLVNQETMQVEVYRRESNDGGAGGWWVDTYNAGNEAVHLASVGLTLSMAAVYEEVVMPFSA